MAEPTQNYANHRVFPRHYAVNVVLFLISAALGAAALTSSDAASALRLIAASLIVLGFAGVSLTTMTRSYALTLQDRVIRAEMRARLEKVLPVEMQACIHQLTKPQLIGLRFASDDELPALTEKVLGEHIEKADAIKQLVKNWQADHERV